ncbi:MAG: DnaA regulatory inactivator Hda [Arenicellales bacterium]
MSRQLALKVGLSDRASFDNFHSGPNLEAVQAVREAAAERPGVLYLHGPSGSGKSHLLYAALKEAQKQARPAVYVSRAAARAAADWMDLPGDGLVCIDDIGERLAPAEGAGLFSLYERSRSRSGSLMLASRPPPQAVDWRLADLYSRLRSGLAYRLVPLGERDLEEALRMRAVHRGIHLPDEVMRFMLRRYERSPSTLFHLLDRIDSQSLVHKRRITIPFLRTLEAEGDPAAPE